MGNYIEGTSKKFPSTNFSHFPTYAHGLHYLLLISLNHSFFFFSFPKFPRLFNLQWLKCFLPSLFSSYSSSFSFVFSLSHRLCFMPSTRSFSFFLFSFLFHLLYKRSSGSDFFSFYFLRGKKSQNVCRSNLWIRPEFTEINRNVRNTPE